MIKIIYLILASTLLVACSDNTDSSKENNQTSENNLYFYTINKGGLTGADNLIAYDNNSNSRINVTQQGSKLNLAYSGADINITEGSFSNYQFKGVYYSENGLIYLASEDADGNLMKRQLSSLSSVDGVCNSSSSLDYLFFSVVGLDGVCDTADDTGPYVITPDMDESSNAINVIANPIIAVISSATSEISSWIVFLDGELIELNKNFTIKKSIGTGFTSVKYMNQNYDYTVFNIDGQVRIYNDATSTLSASLHPLVDVKSFGRTANNNTTLYFRDDKKFYSLNYDGNSTSKLLADESLTSLTINIVSYTKNLIFYTSKDANSAKNYLKTVDMITGEINSLITSNSGRVNLIGVNLPRVYYNSKVFGNGRSFAGVINIDGTGKIKIADSAWVESFWETDFKFYAPDKQTTIILNEFTFNLDDSILSGTLYSYDANSNTRKVMLGTLPDTFNSVYFRGRGSKGLVEISKIGFSNDVYYVDVNQAQSLRPVDENNASVQVIYQ